MLVAVTGATGLVGNNVVRFFLNLGFDILSVVHPEDGLQSLEGLSVRVVRADITNPEQLREALKGAEAVVHAAGLVSITEASKDKLEAVNVEGTKNVIEACKANGVKKLIYISSIHALPADQEGPIKENKDLSVNRVQGAYAKTKVKATLLAFQAAREGLCTVVLHPTGIVGPYDFRTSIVGKLIINALSGKLKWYVSGGYDFVDARDVAKATYLALEKGKCGENYIVAGDYISMKDFLEQCFETAGKPFNLKEIPYALALGVSPFMEWYEVNKGKEPQMSIYALKTLRSKSDTDSSKIREELGFEPMPMAKTVKDLTNWYLSRMKEAEMRRRKNVGTKMPFGGGENFMRKGVVDSFEDNEELVVIELEDKTTIAVPKGKFICEVHVNDVVYETESGLWQVDKEETKSKLEEVQNLMDELWEKEE